MYPPTTWYLLLKWTSMNLPKRELLLLRVVLALPKASRIGLAVGENRNLKAVSFRWYGIVLLDTELVRIYHRVLIFQCVLLDSRFKLGWRGVKSQNAISSSTVYNFCKLKYFYLKYSN